MEKAQTNSSAHVCTTQTTADYIANLPAWDKVPRLGTWLPHVLNESVVTAGRDRWDYLSLVGKYWLLAMARRAMKPGCKFAYCPVLEGGQGLRKSALAMALAGEKHFSAALSIACPDVSKEKIQSLWIYEVAELEALSKANLALLKSFITNNSVACRQSYDTNIKLIPRRFVVIATSSRDSYRSKGATRSFWPVPVRHPINIEWVQAARDQLFAEAKEQQHLALRIARLTDHPGNPASRPQGGEA